MEITYSLYSILFCVVLPKQHSVLKGIVETFPTQKKIFINYFMIQLLLGQSKHIYSVTSRLPPP